MKKLWSYSFLLLVWYLISFSLNNDILLPSPIMVINKMMTMLKQPSFYTHLLATVVRIFWTVVFGFLLALLALILTLKSKLLKQMLEAINDIIRTLPVAAFLIISLIWLGREISIMVVGILIIFPILYDFLVNATHTIETRYKAVLNLYGSTFLDNIFKVYLPLMMSALIAMLRSSILLAIKTTINAEVLVAIMNGIGYQLAFARSNLDMVTVLAYSGWMVLISLLISSFLGYLSARLSYLDEV